MPSASDIPALVRQLCSSSTSAQEQAAWALGSLAANNPSNKAAIKSAGAIRPLVRRLESPDDDVVTASARALRNLSSGGTALQAAIAAAGGLPALVELLGSGNAAAIEQAEVALRNIKASDPAVQAAAADSIPALVGLLDSSKAKVVQGAASQLQLLAANNPGSKAAIERADGIPALVRRLAHYSKDVVASAARALGNLSSGGTALEAAIAAAGGLPALLELLGSGNEAAMEQAEVALRNINSNDPAVRAAATGSIPALVGLLDSSNLLVLLNAANKMLHLSSNHPGNKAAIGSAGGVSALVRLLRHHSPIVQSLAAGALRNLATETSLQPAIEKENGVKELVRLLVSSTSEPVLKSATTAVRRLAIGTPRSQAAIKDAGGIAALVRLICSASGAVLEHAMCAVGGLTTGSAGIQAAIYDAGGWEALVSQLGSSSVGKFAAQAVLNLLEGAQRDTVVFAALRQDPGRVQLLKEKLKSLDPAEGAELQRRLQAINGRRPEDSGYEGAQRAAREGMAQLNLGAAAQRAAPAVPAVGEIQWRDIVEQEKLGAGSFGEVWRATYCSTPVAVKKMLDAAGAHDLPSDVHKEAMLMAQLRHPQVVTLMGVCRSPPALVMELCDTSLCDLLRRARRNARQADRLTWPRRISMLLDAARGMVFLHHHSVLHRDFKSPNLLVDGADSDRPRVKVTDFGLSKLAEINAASVSRLSTAYNPKLINARWLAPELAVEGERASAASDMFAFGLVMWEVLTWQLPWPDKEHNQIVGALARGHRPAIPSCSALPGRRSGEWARLDDYTALMKRCWAEEPAQRPPFTEVVVALEALQD